MKIVNLIVAAALATGVVGATAASADMHHHGHKVCRTSWMHHHRVTHCMWR